MITFKNYYEDRKKHPIYESWAQYKTKNKRYNNQWTKDFCQRITDLEGHQQRFC